MEIEALLKEMTGVFRKVLDNDSVVLQQETTANDIEEWDSLTHVQLIVALEQHFNIRFTSFEIQKFKNVGDLCRAINAKVG